MKKLCLLLTATIEIKNKELVSRNNTATRLEDYKRSLEKWLTRQRHITDIVFVDNSGYPLDELKQLVKDKNPFNKQVEFVSFVYDTSKDRDTSMGEIRSIEYALIHAKLLQESEAFVNLTGRVYVRNIDAIVSELSDDFHVVSTLSENLMYLGTAGVITFFDTACYKKHINNYVITQMEQATEHVDFENVYARAVHYILEKNYRWYPFPYEPILEGMSGKKNIPYQKRFGARRAFIVNLLSRFYYPLFRTAYRKSQKFEHLLKRWQVPPKE